MFNTSTKRVQKFGIKIFFRNKLFVMQKVAERFVSPVTRCVVTVLILKNEKYNFFKIFQTLKAIRIMFFAYYKPYKNVL